VGVSLSMSESKIEVVVPSDGELDAIKVYRERWYILIVFALLEMANALLWVTFAPISDLTQHYFNIHSSYGSTTSVNMLANIFLILYAPGSLLGIFSFLTFLCSFLLLIFLGMMLVKYYQPRKTLLVAGWLTLVGAFLRFLAVAYYNELGNANAYGLVFLGQAFAALAQPMILNLIPALASIWFPINEREIATTIGSMCSPVGKLTFTSRYSALR
jgi:FLVCR family MFS transporter 7